MTKKIFRSFMVSAAAVLLAAVAIVMTCLYSYFASVQENQLQDQLQLAAAAVETQGRDYLNKLTADRYRLTWIAPDGAVLCDTKRDAESLENHGDRLEVREALRTGSGHSTRYSSTLLEKTSYYARRMPDGTVLRISISRATVGMLLLGMLPAILLTAAVALILSGLLAGRLSRRITAPLNALDLEHPLENDTYEELSPLLCRINVQRRQIDSQLTDLRRRSDEFQQITSHMQEGLVLLDDAGAVLSINPAACRIFEADETCLGQDFLTVDRSRYETIKTGKMTYFSRSRQKLWVKGETSGHFQYVKSLTVDCDLDTLLAKVDQIGAACHTGNPTCFFQPLVGIDYDETNPLRIFESVYDTIADRKENPKEGSYTNYLFDKGIDKILKKIGEEATEVVIAAKNPNPEEVKYEIADFLYHAMVLMVEKGLTWEDIVKELADR